MSTSERNGITYTASPRRDDAPGRPRRAFTLLEMLIVAAIVALLVAILIPTLAEAKIYTRTTVCASNLKSLGLATTCYLDDNSDHFFRYSITQLAPAPTGTLWWFGFEPTNTLSTNRPLDKTQSPLALYTANLAELLQCPDFPYNDPLFFPKFQYHAASYGYNKLLGPTTGLTKRRQDYPDRQPDVVTFADAVQFDFGNTFNEGHYINFDTNPASTPDGYAHYRHRNYAQYVLMDGHVDSQLPMMATYRIVNDAPATNLLSPEGTDSIYGY